MRATNHHQTSHATTNALLHRWVPTSRLKKALIVLLAAVALAVPVWLASAASTNNAAATKVGPQPPLNVPPVISHANTKRNLNSAPVAATIYVNDDWVGTPTNADPDGAGPATNFGVSSFATIQDGVNGAAPGDTVFVYAGNYTEQVTISKNLTLTGENTATTVLHTPATLSPRIGGTLTLVQVDTSAVVDMSALTISGPHAATGCADPTYYGIFVVGGANLNLHDAAVTDIQLSPASLHGCQTGIAVRAGSLLLSGGPEIGTVTVNNVAISGYQKSAIIVDNTGSTGTITNNTLTGLGPENIAANAIQIGRGAGATITGNNITANECNNPVCGPDPLTQQTSTGVLVFSTSAVLQINNNTISNNDIGVYNNGDNTTISGNTMAANRYEGIFQDQGSATITGNTLTGPMNVGVVAASFGANTGNSTATLTGNTITGATTGLQLVDETNADVFVPQLTAHFNRIVSGTTAIDNPSNQTIDLKNNWWGCNAGPGNAPVNAGCGTVTGTGADFTPWFVVAALAVPTSMTPGGTSNVSVDMTHTSDSGVPGSTPPDTPVSYDATPNGSMTPASGTITTGAATSLFTSTTANSASITVTVDNQNLNLPITVTPPSFSINDITQSEGNAGTTNFTFTVTKTGATGLPSSVQFQTLDGTATLADNDYVSNSGTLNFGSADTSLPIVVQVKGDVTVESNETFTVHLSAPSGATISHADGIATIFDDDRPPASVVYVDDNWLGTTLGTDPDAGAGTATEFGYDSFATIQDGINGVAPGGTVMVYAGTYDEDLAISNAGLKLLGAGANVVNVRGPIGGPTSTISVTASNVTIAGFTITRLGNDVADWNDANGALNTAGISIASQSVTNVLIRDNVLTGNRTGIDINNSNGHTIRNNVIDSNRTGLFMRNQTDSLIVVENFITNNWTVGILFLDASGGTNSPIQTAQYCVFSNNNVSGNWYGQIVDRQTGGSLPAPGANPKNLKGNWYGTTSPVVTTANSAEPGYAAQIPVAFGGTATPPGGQPDIAGPASANFQYVPFLQSGTDTDIETTPGRGTRGFQGVANAAIVVRSSSLKNWAQQHATCGAAGTGSQAFVFGPPPPPIGEGSLQYLVGANGDSVEAMRSPDYNLVRLDALTQLGYSTYAATAGGQAPYMRLDVDNDNNGTLDDSLFFEPVYQNGTYSTIFPETIPNQCGANPNCVTTGQWQTWNTLTGGWWSNVESGGGPPLISLARYVVEHPNARIINNSGFGGLRISSGCGAGAWDNFNGNTDDVIVGVSGANARYDFEPLPRLSIDNVTHDEGQTGTTPYTFTVSLSRDSDQTVTVTYETANDSAIAPADYTALSPTVLTFNPGETSKTITVNVNGDAVYEGTEQFFVNLSSPNANAVIANGQGVGTITEDDTPPSFTIDDVSHSEGNSGTTTYTFTVTKTGTTAATSSVDFQTQDGSATLADNDYQTNSGSLTFGPAETTKPVTVLVNGDTTFEPNEAFNVHLQNASNATISDADGTGSILNDDCSGASTTVYVDRSWAGTIFGTDPDGGGLATSFGCDSFATIQDGINGVAPGGTVIVHAGTYQENVLVNKSVSLLGPNAAIDPNTGSRLPEAIVLPAAVETSVQSSTSGTVFRVGSNSGHIDATIKGFDINGHNASLTGGRTLNAVEIDTGAGIINSTGSFDSNPGAYNTTMVVQYNIIHNLERYGVLADNVPARPAVTGTDVSFNKIDNLPSGNNFSGDRGRGIAFEENVYGSVTNNVITRVNVGWQDDNYNLASPGAATFVSNNTIRTYHRGIFHNLQYQDASAATISNNNIFVETTGAFPATTTNFGVELASIESGVGVSVSNNNSTGNVYGILLWNLPTTADITVTGGTLNGNQYGVYATSSDPQFGNGAASHSFISGVTIANATVAGIGIADGGNIAQTQLGITGSTSVSGGPVGLLMTGPGARVFNNNLNNTTFTGQTSQYISLANGASAGLEINGTGVSFDALTGATATLAQNYSIEDKITHAIDDGTVGFVRVKAGDVFVTPNSFTAGTLTPSIQRGVDAAAAGNTLHAAAGLYPNIVNVNKALTLEGANVGVAGAAARGVESVIRTTGNQNAVVTVTGASNVTINGFTIDGDDPLTTGGAVFSGDDANVFYAVRPTGVVNNLTMTNNIVKKVAIGIRGDVAGQGNLITNNWFDSIGNFDFGYCVSIRNNFYADVTNNKMTRAWTGVHINNHNGTGGPASFNVTGNEIHSYAGGILYWLQYNNATGATINNNQITAETGAVANNFGVLMVSIQNAVTPTFTNNTITGTDYGIGLTNTSTSNVVTIGSTNAITGTKLAGVYLTDNLTFNPIGTTDLTTNIYTGPTNNIAVNLTGLPVSIASGSAVKVQNSRSSADVTSTATISGSTLSGAAGKGLEVIGPMATANMTASTITGLGTGIALQNSSATPLSVVAHFNRIIAAAAIDNPNNQAVDLENNWWGCNGGPGGTGCGTTNGLNADFDPRIVLGVSASPTSTFPGGTSTVTADMTHNSDGNAPVGVATLPLPSASYTATNGTIPTPVGFTSGQSQSTFTSNSPSSGSACGKVDNEEQCTPITVVLPSFSISDVTLAEGNSGTTAFTFTITKAGGGAASIDYATLDGTAKAPADYTAISPTTLSFASGDTSKTVTVQINGDTTYEAAETFTVHLSNPVDATITDADGLGTITNDDTCAAFSTVYVNASWAGTAIGDDPDGGGPATVFGCDSFATIQAGADNVTAGGTVNVAAGTYTENVTIPKGLTLTGAGAASVFLRPAVSNPNCGGAGGGSLCGGASNLILVQADNVTISGLTLDGDNPALTSSENFGGANIDARNGIITNHAIGTFNNLEVHHTTVKNIYLRGIYASSSGTFNFHDNTVQNVQADPSSIGMFNFGGNGAFTNNTVSGSNDAISSNHSSGTTYTGNTVTNSASGIHSDNAGDGGGTPDTISGNTVSNSSVNGYGIWVFVPYKTVTVQNNTITNVDVGLAAFGDSGVTTATAAATDEPTTAAPRTTAPTTSFPKVSNEKTGKTAPKSANTAEPDALIQSGQAAGKSAAGKKSQASLAAPLGSAFSASFIGNTVDGQNKANSTGAYFSTSQLGFGSGNPKVSVTGNTIINNVDGFYLEAEDGFTLETATSFNRIVFNTNSGATQHTGAGFAGTLIGLMENNWWGCNAGPNHTGCGSVVGAGIDFNPWIVLGVSASPASIPPFGTSTVTADMTHDSNGGTPAGVTTLPLPNAAFTATNGNISPTSNGFTAGQSQSTFTSTSPSSGQGCAAVDSEPPVCTPITVTLPAFSINDVTLAEGNSGTTAFTFTITKTGAGAASVNYATADGTATAPSDYTAIPLTTLSFASGDTSKQVTVQVKGDLVLETNENFTVHLSNPVDATISDADGLGTINNDDSQPNVVYVDDDFTGPNGSDPDGAGGPAIAIGYDAFKTIQEGVDAVADNGTVNVYAGNYPENVTVPKSLSILGPNAAINPNTGTRVAEAVVRPAVTQTSVQASTSGTIFRLGTGSAHINVTLKGFTLDGNNPSLTGGRTLNGVEVHTGAAIVNSIGSFDANPNAFDTTMVVQNNIIQNLERYGVLVDNVPARTPSAGNDVSFNKIDNLPSGNTFTGDRGRGIAFEENVYGTASFNVMTRVNVGWQDDNYNLASPGSGTLVDHNEIHAYHRGIFHNLQYQDATAATITSNQLFAETTGASTTNFGVELASIQSAVGVTVTNNSSTGNVYGILIWNVPTTNTITVSGGTLTGNQYGVLATLTDPQFGAATAASHAVISGVTVSGATVAGMAADGAGASMEVTGSTITGSAKGVVIRNGAVGNKITGNSIHDNTGLGIDLGEDGITANDPSDTDSGPNNLQNFPIIGSALVGSPNTISGTLNSTPGQTFTIHLYANPACDPSGNGEGQTLIGSTTANTNGSGDAAWTLNPVSLTAGDFITATATDSTGNTSEFSACFQARAFSAGTITFNQVSNSEANANHDVNLVVSRTGGSDGAVSVQYSVNDGTALVVDNDYSVAAPTGTLNWVNGDVSDRFITINVKGDAKFETDETVLLTLSNPTGGVSTGGTNPALTITNDDTAPAFSIDDVTHNEGNAGTTNFTFTVTKTGATGLPSSVQFQTVDGTATVADNDYVFQNGTLNFGAADTTMQVTVVVNGDVAVEPNEAFTVHLSSPSGATISDADGTGTITNDDAGVSVAVSPSSVLEDGATNLVYTFTRNGTTTGALTANFSVGGTATFSSDYTQSGAATFTATTGTVNFAAGSSTATVTIDPTTDTTVEPDETVILTVTPGTGYNVASPSAATGTITNDDADVTLSVSPASVNEDGATNLVYTFTRNGNTTGALTANFSVAGTATFGTDYTQSGAAAFNATSGTVTFAAGSLTAAVTIDPTTDSTVEPDETVILTVTSGTGYNVATPSAATGTITNDDTDVSVAVSPASVLEDGATNLVYTFTRNGNTTGALTANFSVAGTATFNSDYTQSGAATFTATSGTVTFAAASSTATVTIDPATDATVEPDETVILTVTSGTSYNVASPSAATGTITNDDTDVSVAVSPASVLEDGSTNLVYTFTRNGNTTGALTANFSVGGTATFNSDYTQSGAATFTTTSGTVAFAAGSTTATVTIDPTTDSTVEPDETVILTVTTGTGYNVATPSAATGTITNDDAGVSVAVSPASVPEDGAANLVYTFTRSGANTDPVTVNFTVGGTATFNSDYTQSGAATFTAASGTVTFAAGSSTATVTIDPTTDVTVEPDETVILTVTSGTGYSVGSPSAATGTIVNDDGTTGGTLQFSAPTYSTNESSFFATITVRRLGDTTGAVSVDYTTPDDSAATIAVPCETISGIASPRCDFTTAVGTLQWASGDSAPKSFIVLISEDDYVEGPEALTLTLSNPTGGATLGSPSTAILTINDDPNQPTTNPIDAPTDFVRQHYHDFLNREPDQSGFDFWVGNFPPCNGDPQCIEVKRINVSGAFYLSIEFQGTGFFVERLYKSSYGDATGTSNDGGPHQVAVPIVKFSEFLPDTQEIGRGVVVGADGWEAALEAKKVAFTQQFVQRARFLNAYPLSMTPVQFVDTLNANAGNPLSPAERDQLVSDLTGGAKTRAQVLRAVADDQDLINSEFNRGFVLMQYFGFLRRNPNAAPDSDHSGFDFWLKKLNSFNGNFINAEMVKAFLSSTEYRHRAGAN